MKGQTWVEFIIATSVFLLSISFIFVTASGNLKEEIQTSNQQSACLKAYELESILKSPGIPVDWDSTTGFLVLGIGKNSSIPITVSNDKWLAMQNYGFANVSLNATPSQSWNIRYDVYAFAFNASNLDTNCITENAVTICRTQTPGFCPCIPYIAITANSTQQSKTNLKLFFPFTTIKDASSTNETNDLIAFSTANGTYANIIFNTNSTDSDYIALETAPALADFPPLIFIEQFNVEGSQTLPFYLGNITLRDKFGAFPPPNAMICNTKVSGILDNSNERLLATYDLEAW
jgi:hypothetical protein